jgi:DNA-3-methyladenine glycosylase I
VSVQQQELRRCGWCQGDELYERYHDEEWGVPVFEVSELFERLALESMQAGLAWITVLKKREHMCKRFHGFDPHKLALCDESDIADWLGDAGHHSSSWQVTSTYPKRTHSCGRSRFREISVAVCSSNNPR